jgi:hypothetical protein
VLKTAINDYQKPMKSDMIKREFIVFAMQSRSILSAAQAA